tara:strand:+ start:707 stop:883 length:177 start_codon:yes stop_codon:yes gene_type:complete
VGGVELQSLGSAAGSKPEQPPHWASARERSRLRIGRFATSLMMLNSPDGDGSESAFSS